MKKAYFTLTSVHEVNFESEIRAARVGAGYSLGPSLVHLAPGLALVPSVDSAAEDLPGPYACRRSGGVLHRGSCPT